MIAEIISKALGARRVGSRWMACCPAHDDREPSLSISFGKNGKVLVCHAGCDQSDALPTSSDLRFSARLRHPSGKALVDSAKMILTMPRRRGRLKVLGDVLTIGEGIETCFTAMPVTESAAWAALSTSGLRSLKLSGDVRDIIILADSGEPGEATTAIFSNPARTRPRIMGSYFIGGNA